MGEVRESSSRWKRAWGLFCRTQGFLFLAATRLAVLEGGCKDFPSHLFIPDSHSLYLSLAVGLGGSPRAGWAPRGGAPAARTYLLRYTRFSVNCPFPWWGSSKGSFWTTSTPSPRSLCSWLCLLIMYSCPILYYKTHRHRGVRPIARLRKLPRRHHCHCAASSSEHQHFLLRKESRHVGLMVLFLRKKVENELWVECRNGLFLWTLCITLADACRCGRWPSRVGSRSTNPWVAAGRWARRSLPFHSGPTGLSGAEVLFCLAQDRLRQAKVCDFCPFFLPD